MTALRMFDRRGSHRAVLVCGALLAACSKENNVKQTTNNDYTTINNVTQVVGPGGAHVESLSGAAVDIPPGALTEDVAISIGEIASGGPSPSPATTAVSPVFVYEPHGQTFAIDVVVTIPHSTGGTDAGLLRAEPGAAFVPIPTTSVTTSVLQARTATFSFFVAVSAELDGAGGSGGSAGAGGMDGSAGTGGGGGAGGSGGAPGDAAADSAVPSCDVQPDGSTASTIPGVWIANPSTPTPVWLSGVVVTAISGGGCTAGTACQFSVQADTSYASLAAGAQHALRVTVGAAQAAGFTAVTVGSQLDLLASAVRLPPPQDELVLQVGSAGGCARVTGNVTPTPISGVTLAELTAQQYRNQIGPLLVTVSGVSGRPSGANQMFALWDTAAGPPDGGPTLSAAPAYLPGGAFSGLADGVTLSFQSVSGVFGVFTAGTDFVMIYPRQMADLVQ